MPRSAPFGSTLPWAEPSWIALVLGIVADPSHVRLRNHLRKWVDGNFAGKSEEWEAAGRIPRSVYSQCAKAGLLVPVAAGKTIPKEWERFGIVAGIKAEEWDGFHDFILWDELARSGPLASLFTGLVVGAPPIKAFASKELQSRILPEVLSGEKEICLAITEPSAGSDVRNITTTAEKTPDGRYYVVNGEKKISDSDCFAKD
ncbi:hypothetical protein H2202_010109 [Exophiala xenobiotica]|nr:hypothetical protein H2202_010109 [Exophiala xenobiotica]